MGKALLCWPNKADTATLTGGSWGGTLDNLKNRFTSKTAISADLDATSTKFTLTYTKDTFLRVLVFYNHNLTTQATIKYTVKNSNGDVLLTKTVDAWPSIFIPTQLEWEYDNFWSGKVDEDDVSYLPKVHICLLDESIFCRSVDVEIFDADNLDGYIKVGRLITAPQWQPAINISYGAALGWEDNTEVSTSLSGTEFFNKKNKNRVAVVRLDFMDYTEATNMALGMTGRLGVSEEVFFVFDPDNSLLLHQRSFNARLRTLSPLEHNLWQIAGMAFELKEVV